MRSRTELAAVAAVLAAGAAGLACAGAPVPATGASPAGRASRDLQAIVARAVAEHGLPGMTAAVARLDGEVVAAAAGARRLGDPEPLRADARMHLASVTKSMTATVVGVLVERGELRFDATLRELLPGRAIDPAYREVTLSGLLRHDARFPTWTSTTAEDRLAWIDDALPPAEQRARFAKALLAGPPRVGDGWAYSNTTYAVAAYVAETAAGRPWEALMEELVFERVGMPSAGFGWPPRDGTYAPMAADDPWRSGPFLAPAGNVHASAEDVARYGLAHLRGVLGLEGPYSPALVAELHRPLGGTGREGYAAGWGVGVSDTGIPNHGHRGSSDVFGSTLALLTEQRLVVAVLVNCGLDEDATEAIDAVIEAVAAELGAR